MDESSPQIGLDKEQSEVVQSRGNAICIAGPGSGKTRVLTSKALGLVRDKVDLICLTFTRAAAQEIRDRIPGIFAGTIHSFCHSVVGWKDSHDDLLARYLQRGQDRFEWVLIDEVQDLTAEQLEVVFSLVGDHLFAVGDPYQSIYGYGGAIGSEVVPLLKSKGCREFRLKANYRSVSRIVSKLNEVYPRGLRSEGVNDNGITAILCRSNDAVNTVTSTLESEGIGHKVRFGSNDFGPKKEIYKGSNWIQVSTIHASKGLEFSNVILYGWKPRKKAWQELGEEINVYYVAMSRAALGYVEASTVPELLGALYGFIPDLESLGAEINA